MSNRRWAPESFNPRTGRYSPAVNSGALAPARMRSLMEEQWNTGASSNMKRKLEAAAAGPSLQYVVPPPPRRNNWRQRRAATRAARGPLPPNQNQTVTVSENSQRLAPPPQPMNNGGAGPSQLQSIPSSINGIPVVKLSNNNKNEISLLNLGNIVYGLKKGTMHGYLNPKTFATFMGGNSGVIAGMSNQAVISAINAVLANRSLNTLQYTARNGTLKKVKNPWNRSNLKRTNIVKRYRVVVPTITSTSPNGARTSPTRARTSPTRARTSPTRARTSPNRAGPSQPQPISSVPVLENLRRKRLEALNKR